MKRICLSLIASLLIGQSAFAMSNANELLVNSARSAFNSICLLTMPVAAGCALFSSVNLLGSLIQKYRFFNNLSGANPLKSEIVNGKRKTVTDTERKKQLEMLLPNFLLHETVARKHFFIPFVLAVTLSSSKYFGLIK